MKLFQVVLFVFFGNAQSGSAGLNDNIDDYVSAVSGRYGIPVVAVAVTKN